MIVPGLFLAVFIVSRCSPFFCLAAPPDRPICPHDWVSTGTRCFTVGKGNLTFDEAEQYCQSLHKFGHLASIHDGEEQDIAKNFLNRGDDRLWIGLRTEGSTRSFKWLDGTSLDYTRWGKLEPNYMDPYEHCAEVMGFPSWNGRWNNVYCSLRSRPVCASPPHLVDDEPGNCSEPYERFLKQNDRCYAIFENDTKSWEEAEEHCQSLGSHLMSVVDMKESFTYVLLSYSVKAHSFWMGIRANEDFEFTRWTDGHPVIYTKWGDMEPHRMENGSCGAFHTEEGKWFTDDCGVNKSFICKHNLVEISTPDPPIEGVCPSGDWIDFGGTYCYKMDKTWGRKTRPEAEGMCIKLGAHLVSIHSKTENDWLAMVTKQDSDNGYWIGLHKPFHNENLRWSDWTSTDFMNFGGGLSTGTPDRCVEMSTDGFWRWKTCDAKKKFICKARKGPVTTPGVYSPTTRRTFPTYIKKWTTKPTTEANRLGEQKAVVSSNGNSGLLWSLVAVSFMGLFLYVYYLSVKRKMPQNLIATDNASRSSLGSVTASVLYEKSDDEDERF